jgi:autophagy-related protein 9
MRADATLLEEEEEEALQDDRGSEEESEMENGLSPTTPRAHQRRSAKAEGKRKVSWDGNASEMNVLRPNIHKEDRNHEDPSDDDEVPQSFMIEAKAGAARHKARPSSHRQESDSQMGTGRRPRPLHSNSGRSVPSVLPTVAPHLSIPPKPSELDLDEGINLDEPISTRARSASGSSAENTRPRNPMGGLDAYERALWNWVNVYNLDAFLQEVYQYYEGKGIYSIALSRGLNLL